MTAPIDDQPNRSPDEFEALSSFVHGIVGEIHVSLPARIEKYDPDKCLADVAPLLQRKYIDIDGNESVESLPVITDVPVAFPSGGGCSLTWPLKPGDPVWLVFSERSLDKFLDSDGASFVDPEDARKHHVSDAWCYPGGGTAAKPAPGATTSDVVLTLAGGATLKIGSKTAAKALAMAEQTDARLSALEARAMVPHGTAVGPTVPPPYTPGGTPPGGSTASQKAFVES